MGHTVWLKIAIVQGSKTGFSCTNSCSFALQAVLHSVVIVTVIIWNLSCFSHGKDGVVYASDGQSINMEYIYEFFNNRCKMKPMECS